MKPHRLYEHSSSLSIYTEVHILKWISVTLKPYSVIPLIINQIKTTLIKNQIMLLAWCQSTLPQKSILSCLNVEDYILRNSQELPFLLVSDKKHIDMLRTRIPMAPHFSDPVIFVSITVSSWIIYVGYFSVS